jgi:hypothetical protein
MAVNSSRSMNAELREGTTDGRYRKGRPDTSLGDERNAAGIQHTSAERSELHPFAGYGFPMMEKPDKVAHTRFG